MPRMRCPGCKRILRIDESSRGDVVACPKCRRRFAVPRFAEDDEPLEEQPAQYTIKEEPVTRPKLPPLLREEDDEDDNRPVLRRRRRRAESGLPDFLGEWNFDKALLVGAVGVWFVLCGLALVHPGFLFGLIGGGILMLLVARIWSITVAFGEDSGTGCATLLFPWYGLFGLEDKRPLFLFAVGILYIATGVGVMALLQAVGRLN